MASTYSAKGTSFPSFQVGKRGITILQGTIDPVVGQGVNGDLYVQSGAGALWQKVAGAWTKLGSFSSRISTGTTSVDTGEVADRVTINSAAKRIAEFFSGSTATNGEKLLVNSTAASVTLAVADTSTTNPVDMVLDMQSTGVLKIQSDADSAIRNSDGSPITVQPGVKADGNGGNLNLRGGNATGVGANGGNIVLTPGTGGSGSVAAQAVLPTTYVAVSDNSLVARVDQANLLLGNVTAESSHAVTANEQIVMVRQAVAGPTAIVLPATAVTGRVVRVKDAKGDAATNNITVSVTGGALIEGQANFVINTNYGKQSFVFGGAAWFLI